MSLKLWSTPTCPYKAITTPGGASTGIWGISGYTSTDGNKIFYYTGEVLGQAPLAIYYGSTMLTQVSTIAELQSNESSWAFINADSLTNTCIYISAGLDITGASASITYRTQYIDLVSISNTLDQIGINIRVCNTSQNTIKIRMAILDSANASKGYVLPEMHIGPKLLLDDSSKIGVPIGYKLSFESSDSGTSVIVTGDGY